MCTLLCFIKAISFLEHKKIKLKQTNKQTKNPTAHRVLGTVEGLRMTFSWGGGGTGEMAQWLRALTAHP